MTAAEDKTTPILAFKLSAKTHRSSTRDAIVIRLVRESIGRIAEQRIPRYTVRATAS